MDGGRWMDWGSGNEGRGGGVSTSVSDSATACTYCAACVMSAGKVHIYMHRGGALVDMHSVKIAVGARVWACLRCRI